MKYNLALDSGGTKVHGILYDENFCPIRTCRVGSMRSNSTPPEKIMHNIQSLMEQLQLKGLSLSRVSGGFVFEMQDTLNLECTVASTVLCGELNAALAAAGITGDGYCVVAGTGSNASCKYNGQVCNIGGYGSCISDEGSGYWIGREAFCAAIRCAEMRGPDTILVDLISDYFGGPKNHFRASAFHVYHNPTNSPIAQVASLTPLVTQAAARGDAVAYDILTRAGRLLAEQMVSLTKVHHTPKDLPVTISGSVWKGHSIIFEEFCRVLQENGMGQNIRLPIFEPIVGIILHHYYETRETLSPEELNRFKTMYNDFLYKTT